MLNFAMAQANPRNVIMKGGMLMLQYVLMFIISQWWRIVFVARCLRLWWKSTTKN